jgi:hypothetical protein
MFELTLPIDLPYWIIEIVSIIGIILIIYINRKEKYPVIKFINNISILLLFISCFMAYPYTFAKLIGYFILIKFV